MVSDEPILTGMAVSRGVAEGRVRVIESDADVAAFKEGEVLVTHITDLQLW